MKAALFTGVWRDASFETVAQLAAEVGFRAVELRALSHLKPDSTTEQVKEIKRIADHYGLAIPVIYSNINGQYVKAAAQETEQKLELLRRYTEWAGLLGAPMICHGPGGPTPQQATAEHFERAAHGLAQAARLLHEGGVTLLLEIHSNTLVETVDSTLHLLELTGSPNVGAILDPGNMAIAGDDYGELAVQRLGDRLLHVHTKDVAFGESSTGKPYQVALMGHGHVDHRPAYRALLAAGYEGYISLEAQVAGVEPETLIRHEYEQLQQALRDIR
ncbi:MAG: xylose isomerase [Paenibacillus sp.]|jgi:sugar phosphate isomerase/epimerase|nr:xylose isomerase [Paenibacillus sp.]